MEGWTGLDRQKTMDDIMLFATKSEAVVNSFLKASIYLFHELFSVWASPNAVDFSNSFKYKYNNLMNTMQSEIVRVISDAERAYNYMAQAEGLPGIYGIEDGYRQNIFAGIDMESLNFTLLDNRDNITGMNINVVIHNIIPNYNAMMSSTINSINDIPISIALYDDENGQQHSFWSNVTILRYYLQEICDSILKEVNFAAENEVDTLLLAKNQAIDALRS